MHVIAPEEYKQQIFDKCYEQIYKKPNELYIPQFVILLLDDQTENVLIMYAGYLHNKNNFYLQHGMKYYNHEIDTGEQFASFLQFIKTTFNVRYITGRTERNNLPALIRCLKTGFEIQGINHSEGNKLYVELIYDCGDGTGGSTVG